FELQLDALGRLYLDDKAVGFGDTFGAILEEHMWRLLELHDDLRRAARHRFTATKIKRHALPAPVVDPEFHSGERGGAAAGADAFGARVAAVLATKRVAADVFGLHRADGLQHLHFFVADSVGFVPHRRFHRGDHQ